MVQLFSMVIVASFALACTSIPLASLERTVPQAEADIQAINTLVTNLDQAINALPAKPSVGQGLAVHTDATALDASIKKAATDTAATSSFSEADGKTILASIQAIEPIIINALEALVAKQTSFQSIPIPGLFTLICADLHDLSGDTTTFLDAIVSKSPADQASQAANIKTSTLAAFPPAIKIYC